LGNLLPGRDFLGKKVQLTFGGDGPPMALRPEPGIERLAERDQLIALDPLQGKLFARMGVQRIELG